MVAKPVVTVVHIVMLMVREHKRVDEEASEVSTSIVEIEQN